MSQIPRTQLLPMTDMIRDTNTKEFADRLITYLDSTIRKIAAIPFNISEIVSISDTGLADTEFTVAHHLSRIPSGFICVYTDIAGVLYDSGTAWTKNAIYLKNSTANCNIKVLVF